MTKNRTTEQRNMHSLELDEWNKLEIVTYMIKEE